MSGGVQQHNLGPSSSHFYPVLIFYFLFNRFRQTSVVSVSAHWGIIFDHVTFCLCSSFFRRPHGCHTAHCLVRIHQNGRRTQGTYFHRGQAWRCAKVSYWRHHQEIWTARIQASRRQAMQGMVCAGYEWSKRDHNFLFANRHLLWYSQPPRSELHM